MAMFHSFGPEGVTIETPDDYKVQPKDFSEMPLPEGKAFFRTVFSFELHYPGDEKVTKSNPPRDFVIWVRWTPADAKFAAQQNRPPTLMIYWEGSGWEEVTPDQADYRARDHTSFGGVVRYEIQEWLGDDPGVGWAD